LPQERSKALDQLLKKPGGKGPEEDPDFGITQRKALRLGMAHIQ
jgi:hypothetical protein